MRKIIDWTFGSVFRTLGRVVAYIIIGLLVSYLISNGGFYFAFSSLLFDNVKASTIDYSFSKFRVDENTSSGVISGSYNDFDTTFNSNVVERTIDVIAVRFGKSTNFKTNTIYRVNIDVNIPPNIDLNSVNFDHTNCYGSTSTSSWSGQSSYIGSCNLVSKIKLNTTNKYRFVYDISFVSAVKGFQISMVGGQFSASSIRVYSSSSIIEDTDLQDGLNNLGDNIINNQNQTTQEIINNQNQNNQAIQDNLNDKLGNKCPNLLSSYQKGAISSATGDYFTANNIAVSDYIKIENGKQYSIKLFNSNGLNIQRLGLYNNDKTFNKVIIDNYMRTSYTFTATQNGYIRINFSYSNYQQFSIDELKNSKPQVEIGSSTSFCEYGSYSSKLDGISSSIGSLTDNILDDNISDNSIQNALNFNTSDTSLSPFSSFLLLPLNWVQNILASNQTCSPISIPLPYVNRNLELPCMNIFWSKMGLLSTLVQAVWLAVVGVRIFNGLFVLTVDSISSKDNDDELTKIRSWEL